MQRTAHHTDTGFEIAFRTVSVIPEKLNAQNLISHTQKNRFRTLYNFSECYTRGYICDMHISRLRRQSVNLIGFLLSYIHRDLNLLFVENNCQFFIILIADFIRISAELIMFR